MASGTARLTVELYDAGDGVDLCGRNDDTCGGDETMELVPIALGEALTYDDRWLWELCALASKPSPCKLASTSCIA
jgi:hypothetical protein